MVVVVIMIVTDVDVVMMIVTDAVVVMMIVNDRCCGCDDDSQ